jgi:hypothetical protein
MQEDKKMAGTGVMNEADEEVKKRCNAYIRDRKISKEQV